MHSGMFKSRDCDTYIIMRKQQEKKSGPGRGRRQCPGPGCTETIGTNQVECPHCRYNRHAPAPQAAPRPAAAASWAARYAEAASAQVVAESQWQYGASSKDWNGQFSSSAASPNASKHEGSSELQTSLHCTNINEEVKELHDFLVQHADMSGGDVSSEISDEQWKANNADPDGAFNNSLTPDMLEVFYDSNAVPDGGFCFDGCIVLVLQYRVPCMTPQMEKKLAVMCRYSRALWVNVARSQQSGSPMGWQPNATKVSVLYGVSSHVSFTLLVIPFLLHELCVGAVTL